MTKYYLLLTYFLFVGSTLSFGQKTIQKEGEKCLAGVIHQELMNSDPEFRRNALIGEENLQKLIQLHNASGGSRSTYTIPVVVHVIHKGEAVGTGTNITDAQIQSAISALNDAFAKKAGSIYDGNGVNTNIQFCLAVRNPANQAHSGINRVNGTTFVADYVTNGITVANDAAVKNISRWDRTRFYNIWIVSKIRGEDPLGGGTQGYATFPNGSGTTFENTDGTVVLYNAFGTVGNLKNFTNKNMTAIHELGHGLFLYHTFEGDGTGGTCPTGNQCGSGIGDCCGDTPPHKRTAGNCGNTALNCGVSPSQFEKNYMDYSNESCTNMFTANQATRMQNVLVPGGLRGTLPQSNGCTPVIQPTSDFTASASSACAGSAITFTDQSSNGPNSWSWTFAGGTPSTSTQQNPVITYSTPGTYAVTLTASNNIGTGNTETKTAYITVYNNITSACTPNSTNLASDGGYGLGPTNVTFNTINNTTGNAKSDGGYKDFSCSHITTLTAGNSYNISISLGTHINQEDLRVYIDYNNDGLMPESERVFFKDNVNGSTVHTGTIVTPVTAVKNRLLRMRVISDWGWNNVTSCWNPENGQAEDYGVYFYSPPTPPVANFTSSSTSICQGESITFTDASTNTPTSWSWVINGGTPSSSTAQNPTAVFNTPGTHDVVLTATNDDGSNSKTISVLVKPKPNTPIAGSNSPICEGVSLDLTSDVGGATYSWTGPSSYTSTQQNPSRPAATTSMSGSYTVSATINGCTSTSAPISVTVNQNSNASISYTSANFCKNETNPSPTLTGTTGGTYSSTAGLNINASTGVITLASSTAGNYVITYSTGGSCGTSPTFSLTIKDAPATPIAGSNSPICEGITLDLTSDVSGASYNWTGPNSYSSTQQNPTRPTATSIMSGTYTISATINGCTSTSSPITVTVNPNTSATISFTKNAFCKNEIDPSPTITGASGGTFSSTNGLSINSSTGLITLSTSTPGSYTITYTPSGGCASSSTTTLSINDYPTISSQTVTNAACGGSNGSIQVVGANGTASYLFAKDGATFQSADVFNNLSAGDYTITIKDLNNCASTKVISVLNISALTSSITSQTNILCNGNSTGSIIVEGAGSSNYLYSLNGGTFQASGTFNNLAAGAHSITVKDLNNCTSTQSTTLSQANAINISANSTGASCGAQNGSVTITANGGTGTLLYSVDGTNYYPNNTFNNLNSGNYTAYVKDNNACVKNTPVTVSNLGGLSSSITAQTNVSCNGLSNGSVTVVASGSGGYIYSINGGSGQTDGNFTGLSAGNYSVSIVDQNSCTITQSVNITQPDALTVSSNSSGATCGNPNGSIAATASGGTGALLYSLNGGSNQSTGNFNNLMAGNHALIITDANSCTSSNQVNVANLSGLSLSINPPIHNMCFGGQSGSIVASGSGTGGYTYAINGGQYLQLGSFSNLTAGDYSVSVKDQNNCTLTELVTITEPPSLILSIKSTVSASCGAQNGEISLGSVGGVQPYQFNLNGGTFQSDSTFTTLGAGSYSLSVKDANNCVSSVTATVTDQSGLSATIASQTNVSCNGLNNGTITIRGNGSSGYSYSSDGISFGADSVFSNLSAGFYTLYIKDVNNCPVSQSVTVTEPASLLLSFSAVTHSSCGEPNGSFTANGSGGIGAYTFSLNGANHQSNNIFSGLNAGIQNIEIKDANNCTTASSITINDNNNLNLSVLTIDAKCKGENSASVTAVGSGSSNYYYSIDGLNYTPNGSFIYLNAGLYTISLIDKNNCVKNNTVLLSEPDALSVSLTSNQGSTCGSNNGSIEVQAVGGTPVYNYSLNGGTPLQNGVFSNLNAGNYVVSVKDGNNCAANVNATVTNSGNLTIAGPSTKNICAGESTTMVVQANGGTGPYQYAWSNGDTTTTLTVNPTTSTTYTVTITNAEQCSSSKNISVVVTPLPTTSVSAGQSICSSQSVIITASGGTSYYWHTGATSSSITVAPISTTTYSVFAIENGCIGNTVTSTISVLQSPTAKAGSNKTTTYITEGGYVDFFNNSLNAASINWNFGDGSSSSQNNPTHQYTVPGIYYVVLTATLNNCTDYDTLVITVSSVVGLNQSSPLTSFVVYPNPSSGILNLEFGKSNSVLEYSIYNSLGEIVLKPQLSEGNKNSTLDLSTYPAGVYFMRVNSNNESIVKKFTILK